MALHDAGADALLRSQDACYELVWTLDAAAGQRRVGVAHLRRLQDMFRPYQWVAAWAAVWPQELALLCFGVVCVFVCGLIRVLSALTMMCTMQHGKSMIRARACTPLGLTS